MTMREFVTRAIKIYEQMTQCTPNFNQNYKVSKEEILDLGEFQMSNDWQLKMTRQDFDPQDMDIKSLITFCECIEATETA